MRAKRPEEYSARNAELILTALPGATELAGYKQWRAMGRQVRRGEHGVKILAPVTRGDDDDGRRRMVNVRGATVFDVSQTDPTDPTDAIAAARAGDDVKVTLPRDPEPNMTEEDAWRACHKLDRETPAPNHEGLRPAAEECAEVLGAPFVRDPGEDAADRWTETH